MPEEDMSGRVCVLGVGNTLLGDEGFGVRAMEYLRDNYVWPGNVDFVDGGTQGMGLMPLLVDYDKVAVLDIVHGQGKPGTVYLLENEDMRKAVSFHDSAHETDFVDLLMKCDLMGCRPETFVVGFEPYDYSRMNLDLTPEAAAALPAFCDKAAKVIRERGFASPVRKNRRRVPRFFAPGGGKSRAGTGEKRLSARCLRPRSDARRSEAQSHVQQPPIPPAGAMPFLFAKSQARRALRIGLPIFVAQLSQIGMNFADTIMSGHYSAEAMAAVAVGCSIWQPASLLAIGCLLALPGMSAQLIGARRCDRAAHLLKQGLLLSCFLSSILIPALWIISDHLGAFGLKPDLVPQARGYLRALLPGLPGFLFFVNIRSLLEGYSRTRPAMIIGMVCLAINIPCNYAFIYGRFGMPQLGAAGCGVATSICFWFMAVSIFYYVVRDVQFRDMRLFTPDHDSGTPFIDLPLILSVLRIGAPNAAAMCLECTLFAVTALLLAPLGTDAVASHQIAMSYGNLIFACPLSVGMTATIMTGGYLGAGRLLKARSAAHTCITLAAANAFAAMAFTVVFRSWIVSFYTSDPHIAGLACTLMLFCAAYQLLDATQTAASGVLRGYNSTAIIMKVCVIAYGGIGLLGGFILGRTNLVVPAMGAPGFWIGYIFALTFSSVCYLWQIHRLHMLDKSAVMGRIAR